MLFNRGLLVSLPHRLFKKVGLVSNALAHLCRVLTIRRARFGPVRFALGEWR